jgi:hypothetical protein
VASVEPRDRPPVAFDPNAVFGRYLRPAYLLPATVVVAVLALAILVQPSPGQTSADDDVRVELIPATPTTTPTPPAATPSPTPADAPATAATAEIAGARSTPSPPAASPTVHPGLLEEPTQCGALRETSVALAVEQAISGISIKATRAAVYPIEYFACILVATGGNESLQLASAVHKQEDAGMTHVILVDLWIANGSRLFGQVNLRTARLAAAGQTFDAIATIGGRSEVVVASGQGRHLTVVAAARTTVGDSLGPMTLVIDAPLAAGTPIAGKYQLFLPTP